jgi:hypothetical protein
MTQPVPIIDTPLASRSSSASAPRLHGRWLLLAQGSWISVVVLTLVIFFGSLPVYVNQLHTRCVGTACVYQQLTAGQVQILQGLGWSLDEYAALQVVLMLAGIAVSVGVSTLIVWRRSDDRMALLVALALVTNGPMIATTSVAASSSPWLVPTNCLTFLSSSLFLLVFFLFPSGKFAPRFMRWTCVVFLGGSALLFFLPEAALIPNTSVSHPGWLLAVVELATVALVQLYRYRRVSSPLEQQQTKWVVFGFAVPITLTVIGTLLTLVPMFAARGVLSLFAVNEMGFLLELLPPLAFGVAILRYRLWDIDNILNKALVYGLLTGLLGALYAGLIIGLESLDGLFGGTAAQNPVVLVISTLAIAALFLPVRRRIQAIIDRSFYRRKYDAEKTLAAFSATLRQETDLEQIREQLIVVVQETMHPAHISLWLRQPESHYTQQAHPLEPHGQVHTEQGLGQGH